MWQCIIFIYIIHNIYIYIYKLTKYVTKLNSLTILPSNHCFFSLAKISNPNKVTRVKLAFIAVFKGIKGLSFIFYFVMCGFDKLRRVFF